MTTTVKLVPDITRAAERYLEQYGDPIVMNTYLKVTILVLAVVSLVLAGLVYRSQRALADMHPMIVRINDVGRAEAIDYRNFKYRPQEAETSITSPAGQSSISAGIASPSSAIRPTLSTSSMATSSALSSTRNARTTSFRPISRTARFRTSMSRSRTSSSTIFVSRRIQRESNSKRYLRTLLIIPRSSASDGPPASPMSSART
jgi:hypothetical protein